MSTVVTALTPHQVLQTKPQPLPFHPHRKRITTRQLPTALSTTDIGAPVDRELFRNDRCTDGAAQATTLPLGNRLANAAVTAPPKLRCEHKLGVTEHQISNANSGFRAPCSGIAENKVVVFTSDLNINARHVEFADL